MFKSFLLLLLGSSTLYSDSAKVVYDLTSGDPVKYKFVNADVMKSVYLISAQNKGYAYIPIH